MNRRDITAVLINNGDILWSFDHVLSVLSFHKKHAVAFLEEQGNRSFYSAHAVLAWLGYSR